MNKIKVGLIDLGYCSPYRNTLLSIQDLMDYAIKADELGFSRFWITEHHTAEKNLGWTNPQTLIPILAGVTNKIRVGTSGILLSIHEPFHVATNFKLLANLYPNRIDLGVANGYFPNYVGQLAENENCKPLREKFDDKLSELIHYLEDENELFEGGKGVVIPPFKGRIPKIWTVGTSYKSLDRALDHKTNFARSIFHEGADFSFMKEKIEEFREAYIQKHHTEPECVLAFSGYCQTDEQKRKVALDVASKDKIIGSPQEFYEKVCSLQERYGYNEFIFYSMSKSIEDKTEELERISELFRLCDN